ncbi:MAG TPA: DinB family protein [Ktedonobacterales bacterium]|nr:DinB family protein [Ktedonobacterales bacterium]
MSTPLDPQSQRPHFAIRVGDLDASLDFYAQVIAFPTRERDDAADVAVIQDQDGDLILVAGPRAGDLAPHLDENPLILKPRDVIEFGGADLPTLQERWLARGASADTISFIETPWSNQTLTVRDPDGYRLTFIVQAVLTQEETLAFFHQGPEALDDALAGLSEQDLDLAPIHSTGQSDEGEWSIRQIVRHLVDGDDMWRTRLQVALHSPDNLYHDWYRGNDLMAERLLYATLPLAPALALLRAGRAYAAQLVNNLPGAWERQFKMTRFGRTDPETISVGAIVRIMADHALEHVEEIRAIRRSHGR